MYESCVLRCVKMKVVACLLITVLYLQGSQSRRLSDKLDDELESSNEIDFGKRPADWVRISHPPKPLVRHSLGSRIELECEAVGSPAPVVQWLQGNRPITENESFENNMISDTPSRGLAKVRSRLVIHSALHVHEGTYTCLAESGSKIATATSKLLVSHSAGSEHNFTQLLADGFLAAASPPRIILFDFFYMDNIGSDIVLPCKAIGNPRPEVYWLDNTEAVISGGDPRLTVLPDGELRITNIRWNDMGPYTCVASSLNGQDNITTFLYPMLAEK